MDKAFYYTVDHNQLEEYKKILDLIDENPVFRRGTGCSFAKWCRSVRNRFSPYVWKAL